MADPPVQEKKQTGLFQTLKNLNIPGEKLTSQLAEYSKINADQDVAFIFNFFALTNEGMVVILGSGCLCQSRIHSLM